ncbi:hypothetical protein I302_103494 [Kwoniella bestiolae CBS 10118]|uniref:Uncharacterized protein n=1 Tax=Kwoniella bestiolae CBS 10118 TaxID=1296100 RepID=A0A1B9G8I9_9TREE|nr:hypothetical protein I302_02195 [Kwoniella bestiolae CBS 10118]OCF27354.1 hypothetical protein I302_02195 [Kwoniella bestiolae CBS 10118]
MDFWPRLPAFSTIPRVTHRNAFLTDYPTSNDPGQYGREEVCYCGNFDKNSTFNISRADADLATTDPIHPSCESEVVLVRSDEEGNHRCWTRVHHGRRVDSWKRLPKGVEVHLINRGHSTASSTVKRNKANGSGAKEESIMITEYQGRNATLIDLESGTERTVYLLDRTEDDVPSILPEKYVYGKIQYGFSEKASKPIRVNSVIDGWILRQHTTDAQYMWERLTGRYSIEIQSDTFRSDHEPMPMTGSNRTNWLGPADHDDDSENDGSNTEYSDVPPDELEMEEGEVEAA